MDGLVTFDALNLGKGQGSDPLLAVHVPDSLCERIGLLDPDGTDRVFRGGGDDHTARAGAGQGDHCASIIEQVSDCAGSIDGD